MFLPVRPGLPTIWTRVWNSITCWWSRLVTRHHPSTDLLALKLYLQKFTDVKRKSPLKYSLHLILLVKAEREANPSPHLQASKLSWEKLTIKVSSTSRCSNDLVAESRPSARYCLREGLTWETLWNLWQNWTSSKNPSASIHKHFTFTSFHNFIFCVKVFTCFSTNRLFGGFL